MTFIFYVFADLLKSAEEIESANCNSANDKKGSGRQVANPQVAAFEEGLLI